MTVFVETLESRAFLSASAVAASSDVPDTLAEHQQRVGADVQKIGADLQHCGETLSAVLTAVGADLQRLAATPEGQVLLDKLQADVAKHRPILGERVSQLVAAGLPAGGAIVNDIVQLYLHRDDPQQTAANRAKLAANLRKLREDTAPHLAALKRDVSAAVRDISRDLRAIARFLDNDPALAENRRVLAAQLNECVQTLRADFKALAVDVQALMRHQRRAG